jgi:NADH dehydrogenase
MESTTQVSALPPNTLPRIVIIGCGFGGLFAARALADAPVELTVLDRTNHHLFQPLLYQVATAGLSAPSIAAPIRHVLAQQRNTTVLLAAVQAIDTAARRLTLEDGSTLDYDGLIVAAGATHSYFGHPEWERDAPGLKTLADAFEIRRRLLYAFEHAERETDAAARRRWLTFVVVGAGATGVEMAGAMAEIARHTLRREFRRFDSSAAEVVLLEGGERVLPAYVPPLSVSACRQLEKLGVTVRLKSLVSQVDAEGVIVNGERLAASTVIWAAGVQASPLGRTLGVPLDRAGRVIVAPDLSIPGHPEVFVIGDLAVAMSNGQPVPGVSPAAKQMGRSAARNILQLLRGEPTEAFVYRDYGSLATIGRRSAVADIMGLKLSGYLAWLTWLFAHVYFLIGFRSRLAVLTDWAWSYWTFNRSARVVIEPVDKAR